MTATELNVRSSISPVVRGHGGDQVLSPSSRRLSLQPRAGNRSFSFVKQQVEFRKPICPFISSTFQDFQVERDILVKKVFPALNAICKQRGTYCSPVDLRWGIDSTQVGAGLVMQLCLDYVQRCSPYFICLLGERYGSCRSPESDPLPKHRDELSEDSDWLDRNLVLAGTSGYEWLLKYADRSVTELEILHAVFLSAENKGGESSTMNDEFRRFYFRRPDHTEALFTDLPEDQRTDKLSCFEAESEYHAQKMADLKATIVKRGLLVEYFKSPEELGMLVFKNWKAILDKLYPPLYDIITKEDKYRFLEWTSHETYAETRRTVFIKSAEIEDMFDHMSEFAIMACEGTQGGKSEEEIKIETGPEPDRSVASLLRKKKPPPAPYQSILALVGDRGRGKTSVVVNWVREFGTGEEYMGDNGRELSVFVHYVGSSAASMDAGKMMRRAISELQPGWSTQTNATEGDEIGETPTGGGSAGEGMAEFRTISEAFAAALARQPCVIVIDGLDEMSGACHLPAKQIKELEWLPSLLPPHCKLIITTLKSDVTYRRLLARGGDVKFFAVRPLKDPDHKKEIVREHLAIHCKSLNSEQLERIVTSRLSDRPLFLTMLANELRVCAVWGNLDAVLDGYLEASSVRDLWSRIIQRWVREYGWSLESSGDGESNGDSSKGEKSKELRGWVADTLRLIAVSRHGLSTAEILAILPRLGYHGDKEVTAVDWAVFRCAVLDALFERPGGLLTFFHRHFKEAVEHTLLGVVTPEGQSPLLNEPQQPVLGGTVKLDKKTFHGYLADYYYEQAPSSRRTDELPWQLERAEDYDRLCKVLSDPEVFLKLFGDKTILSPRKVDLIHYWQILCENNYDPSATYNQTLEKVLGETIDGETLEDVGPETLNDVEPVNKQMALAKPRETKDTEGGFDRSDSITTIEEHASAVDNDADSYVLRLGNHIGFFLCALGEFRVGEKILLWVLQKLLATPPPVSLSRQKLCCMLQESLGNMCFYLMRRSESEAWYNKALKGVKSLLESVTGGDDKYMLTEMKGKLLDHLGTMRAYDGDYAEAERMLHRARKCMEYVQSKTGMAQVHYHIGVLRSEQGDFVRAMDQFRKSLSTYEKWFGKSHPRVADVLEGIAGILSNRNYHGYNKKEAEKVYRRSLTIRENLLGPKHLLVATTLCHLGHLLSMEPKLNLKLEAVDMLKRALDIRTTKLGHSHPLTGQLSSQLSELEVRVNYIPSRPPDLRSSTLPASTLSWHDRDLARVTKKGQTPRSSTQVTMRSRSGSGGQKSYFGAAMRSRSGSGGQKSLRSLRSSGSVRSFDGGGGGGGGSQEGNVSNRDMAIITVRRKAEENVDYGTTENYGGGNETVQWDETGEEEEEEEGEYGEEEDVFSDEDIPQDYIQSSKEILLQNQPQRPQSQRPQSQPNPGGSRSGNKQVRNPIMESFGSSQWSAEEHSVVLDQRLSGFLDGNDENPDLWRTRPGSGTVTGIGNSSGYPEPSRNSEFQTSQESEGHLEAGVSGVMVVPYSEPHRHGYGQNETRDYGMEMRTKKKQVVIAGAGDGGSYRSGSQGERIIPPVPIFEKYYRSSSAPTRNQMQSNGRVQIQGGVHDDYYNATNESFDNYSDNSGRPLNRSKSALTWSQQTGRLSNRPQSSTTSSAFHRSRCSTPGPHSVIGTVTAGPHCGLTSLLQDTRRGLTPVGAKSSSGGYRQTPHTSAWYQVPGRYPTADKPYPPKRSQVRRRVVYNHPPTGFFVIGSNSPMGVKEVDVPSLSSASSSVRGGEGIGSGNSTSRLRGSGSTQPRLQYACY